jgi:hypothetical protein
MNTEKDMTFNFMGDEDPTDEQLQAIKMKLKSLKQFMTLLFIASFLIFTVDCYSQLEIEKYEERHSKIGKERHKELHSKAKLDDDTISCSCEHLLKIKNKHKGEDSIYFPLPFLRSMGKILLECNDCFWEEELQQQLLAQKDSIIYIQSKDIELLKEKIKTETIKQQTPTKEKSSKFNKILKVVGSVGLGILIGILL